MFLAVAPAPAPCVSLSLSLSANAKLVWNAQLSHHHRLFSCLRNRRRKTRRGCAVDHNHNGFSNSNSNSNSSQGDRPPPSFISKSRREMLLEYVRNVQPEFLELFVKRASPQVVEAMRQTVTNMIGTLPPQFFAITVTTVAENLAQLMYSVMMTGYMFKNAQYRLELQRSLEQAALTDGQNIRSNPEYAPGTQKKVTGEVIRWRNDSGPEKIDAFKYIELLEGEIEELQHQLERGKASSGQNEILEYLKSLEPQNLQELTSSAGEDALDAMNTFIQRLLGVSDPAQLKVPSLGVARSNRQFLSSTKVEYRSVMEATKEAMWLKILLDELHMGVKGSTLLLCDNQSCIALANNPVQHQRMKHIEIHMLFIREKVLDDDIDLQFCPTEDQVADIFTKLLCAMTFFKFRALLGLLNLPLRGSVHDNATY